jgi:predicted aldo/keto reductase-like oxidoreductase
MQYREMNGGDKVSVLGFGCMRFQTNKDGSIKEDKASKQLLYAIENGVNYLDTAKPYHGGRSEPFVGKFLEENKLRDKVFIATKLSYWYIKEKKDMQKHFDEQLKDLRTDYIDYYLVHSLNGKSWAKLKELGVLKFLDKLRKQKKIRNVGFSFHGNIEHFYQIVDDYDWSFCQIQFNILDTEYQAGMKGYLYAVKNGLSVISMEPLRGGRLAQTPPEKVKDIYDNSGFKRTPAEWALRWVWNYQEITTLLSGMNQMKQIKENIKISKDALPGSMTREELQVIEKATKVYKKLMKIGCTGCMYCLPCPVNVAIPSCFEYYNGYHLYNDEKFKTWYKNFLGDKAKASLCVNCGECVKKCPQGLKIPDLLKKVVKEFE